MIILKRQLYSYIELEQREYNIISDLYHSGIKRTYKKNVGRIRRSIGNKLTDSATKQREKANRSAKVVENLEKLVKENKGLTDKLKSNAVERKIGVIDKNLYHNMFEVNKGAREDAIHRVSPEIKKAIKKEMNDSRFQYAPQNRKDMYKKMLDNDSIINLKGNESTSYLNLAHEIGHDINRDKKSTRNLQEKTIKLIKSNPNDSIMRRIKSRRLIVKEEKNADKNARKLLRSLGAAENELQMYDRIRKNAINNYKHSKNTEILKGLAKKVQVKGKRRNDIDNI